MSGGARDSLLGLFENPAFGYYVGTRVTSMAGMAVQTAALSWQVYEITGSALPLALLGLFRFVPSLLISFVGGAVADTYDRRFVLAGSQIAPLGTSLALTVMTAMGTIDLRAIYVSVVLLGIAGAFEGPARASLLPLVVARESFQRAVALTTTVTQLAGVFGPAVAGIIMAELGLGPAYLLHVALVILGIVFLVLMRLKSDRNRSGEFNLALIKEGLDYIWAHPALLGAMAIDMFAVIFSTAEGLLPIYAQDILGVGAVGFGLLNSSKAVGAFLTAVAMTLLPPLQRTGRALVLTIIFYGLATTAFALSTSFGLSMLLFATRAAFDQVSVVIRQTMIQLGTPDALRGRVSAVNQVFIQASNQLGAVEAGLVATWAGSAVIGVAAGGLGCLAVVAIMVVLIPSLWPHRVDLAAEEVAAAERRARA